MSEIVIGKSDGKNVALDLNVLLRTRLLIQANSGKGKSWLLRRLAEQLFGKVQVIIIDPEGEFASLREKFGYVLVGKGGETPADPRSAALVAHKLLELRAPAVCDLYEMKPSARHEWAQRFFEAMIDAPKNLWHPCIVMLDEAHVFCPEKGAGESLASESVIGMATRGRKRGFCLVAATQRLGKFRKDAAAEMLNVMIGGTFIDIDRKRAADALGVYGAEQHKFFDQIKLLERGSFYTLGPAISDERILLKVGAVETSHPEAGSSKHAVEAPPAPEKVKALLPKLADLPKAAEEKARTESELRAEIRSLKAQIRSAPKETVTTKVGTREIERALRQAESKRQTERRESVIALKRLQRDTDRAHTLLFDVDKTLREAIEDLSKVSGVEIQKGEIHSPSQVRPERGTTAKEYHPRPESSEDGNGNLRAGAERMLAALAQWHPGGMAEGQMRSHAGLKKSGTFSAYMSDLRRGQYIEERGRMVYATEAGLEYCKHVPAAPSSTEEVLAIWNPKLRYGARRMLAVLVKSGGDPIDKESLGELAGLVKSGTFSAYLSDLKTARLAIVNRDGSVAANRESLFL